MKIKSRSEILGDIIRDARKFPKGWKATFGIDDELLSHDYYIFNPDVGIYLLKEYQKNPFEIKGTGAKIARHVDEDIARLLKKNSTDFGIIQGDIRKMLINIKKGIPAQTIFDAALQGKDLGMQIPVRGRASSSKSIFTHLRTTLSTKQKKLDYKLEKMIEDDGIYNSYI